MTLCAISIHVGDHFGEANEYALAFIVHDTKTKFKAIGLDCKP